MLVWLAVYLLPITAIAIETNEETRWSDIPELDPGLNAVPANDEWELDLRING